MSERQTVVDISAGESIKNPAAVELGRLGGLKGGPARAESMTKEARVAQAKKASQARWAKERRKAMHNYKHEEGPGMAFEMDGQIKVLHFAQYEGQAWNANRSVLWETDDAGNVWESAAPCGPALMERIVRLIPTQDYRVFDGPVPTVAEARALLEGE